MSHIIVNGNRASSKSNCISPFDRGLTLGHGLFETILVNKGSAPLLDYHWNRLATSVKYLGINLPFNIKDLTSMIAELIHANDLTDTMGGLRLMITDGISERGLLSNGNQKPTYILTSFKLPETSPASLTATIVDTKRNENSLTSKIKSISYLDNIFAKKEAVIKGFDEAFLLNSKLNLAEGSISNVFIVKSNTIYTPPLIDGALPGVVRHVILNKLITNGIKIKEQHINTAILHNADEIFISNAILGIKPICKLDDMSMPSPFEITNLVATCLKNQFNYI